MLILADLLQAQGRYKDAQRLAEAALDIYERAGVEKAVHADALAADRRRAGLAGQMESRDGDVRQTESRGRP